ncbi:MAG: alanine--tRNA ligase [Candidatus Micrarchaeia archaeon]
MVSAKGVMMLDKNSLREEFSSKYKEFYLTDVFEKEGFIRKKCKICGKYFWTSDPERELCGDPEHEAYSFFKDKPIDVSYSKFWKRFAEFFKKNGHEEIKKYPVVSRWRQDLYFTIASIQDFQRIEHGIMNFEYPANPLIVPQICLRFNDIPNVGITGRHFTSFMMAGQHAFNYPNEGYWRDRTIELNYKFLTEVLGVKKENLTYTEDVWAMNDFSEYGPCLESFSNGVELVNNVFTQFGYANGSSYELAGKVVDVGWGFERLVWFYSGSLTAYDAVFQKPLEYIYKESGFEPDRELYAKIAGALGEVDLSERFSKNNYEYELARKVGIEKDAYEKIIKPMQAMYAVADHARTLLFALNDGALPSNVGGGYNLRIILRRMLDFIDGYGINIDIMKLMEIESEEMKGVYEDIGSDLEEIKKVIETENRRYASTKEEAKKIVTGIIKSGKPIEAEQIKRLYESNGITPDLISKIAKENNKPIEISESIYSSIVKGDLASERKKKTSGIGINLENLPQTEKLYYDYAIESISKVLKIEGNFVVLDKTPFYPEGGGQDCDLGTINGQKLKDVQIINNIVVHELAQKPEFLPNEEVDCKVDYDRRSRLMAHHTATHLVSAAARKVLGKHAWQEGAHKSPDKAHIDISHYERLSEEQIAEIEKTANDYILNGFKVKVSEMDRAKAESEYGFSIYQGHGVPSKTLRIVKIASMDNKLIDAEACGGLHMEGIESAIGLIKILNSTRIHDGIDRIEFTAGKATLDKIQKDDLLIRRIAEMFNTSRESIESSVEEMLNANAELTKHAKKYEEIIASMLSDMLAKEASDSQISRKMEYNLNALRLIGLSTIDKAKGSKVFLFNEKGEAVACSSDPSKDAVALAKEEAAKMGSVFKGGGSARIAEGKLVK